MLWFPVDWSVQSVAPDEEFSGDEPPEEDVDFLGAEETIRPEEFESTVDVYYQTQYELDVTDKPTTYLKLTQPTYDVYALN